MQPFGQPLKLVILDVDGVIIDLMAGFESNLKAAARQCGLPLRPIDEYLEEVRAGVKHHHSSWVMAVQMWWPWLGHAEAERFGEYFRAEERRNPYPPVAGSIEAIHRLRARRVSVALCTTNEKAVLVDRLQAAGINPNWFYAASTWESGYPKPDPRSLDSIFKVIPVPREQAVYVGDWYPDLEAARGAGVRFIAVLSGGIPRKIFIREGVPEDHILERLGEFPKLIQEESAPGYAV